MQRHRSVWIAGLSTLAIVVVVGVLVAARSGTVQALLGRWSFIKSVTNDDSTYYRLKVKLAYKGEPQDFDIVVGCNVREIIYKDNSRTYEAGLIPTVFGRRMSDGKGLVVRPPNACRGETTANGRVQPDLLPLIVVYDNADTLEFGIAYLSEDAYESPLSVLKFGGATIEKATRAEFDAFRRTQTNVVTRSIFWTGAAAPETLKKMGITPAIRPFAGRCQAYKRYLIPEEVRPLVKHYWPDSKPQYWVPDHEAASNVYREVWRSGLVRSDSIDDPPHDPRSSGPVSEFEADLGMPTRRGGGLINSTAKSRTVRFPAAYYPAANDFRSDRWPTDRSEWPAYVTAHGTFADDDIDFRDGLTKGFAYCFAQKQGVPDSESREILRRKGIVARVNGQDVQSNRASWGGVSGPTVVLERDEYMFRLLPISLGSPRGDV